MPKKRKILVIHSLLTIVFFHASASVLAAGTEQRAADITFTIPAGISLQEALQRFASQANLSIQVDESNVHGLVSGGFTGKGSINSVLTRLLAGTTLAWQTVSANTLKIIPVDTGSQGESIGVVNVEGQSLPPATAMSTGVNGSSDITATEGSGSLNGSMASTVDGKATNVKDMTKSVSVISHKQITEQNTKTLSEIMSKAPGVTVAQTSGNLGSTFFSRGFAINQATVDGGTSVDISNGGNTVGYNNNLSSAIYDHVEVLRGANMLGGFSSSSGISGSVNLVRKRPVDHFQLIYSTAAGSWNNYQNMLDVSGPLNDSGSLRGRTVLSWQKQDYFYHYANRDDRTVYNILEFNLTPSTLLTAGVNYHRLNATPWISGLSMYEDGSDPKFSRKTSFTQPWAFSHTETKEFFAGWEQQLGDQWGLKTNYDGQYTQFGSLMPSTAGPINEGTGEFDSISGSGVQGKARTYSWDTKLSGDFDIGGLTQKLIFGAKYDKNYNSYTSAAKGYFPDYGIFGNHRPDLRPFHWHEVPLAPVNPQTYGTLSEVDTSTWDVFGSVLITPLNSLHLGMSLRLDGYKSYSRTNSPFSGSDENNQNTRKWEKPNYSVSYDLSDNWSVYGDYAYVFTPQLSVRDRQGAVLPPEQGNNMEAGLKYGRKDGTLNASISFYKTRLTNTSTIVIDPEYNQNGMEGYYWEINPKQTIVKGIDSEISGNLTDSWQVMASYNYLTSYKPPLSDNDLNQAVNSYTPKHMLRVWTDYNFVNGGDVMKKITLGGGVTAQSQTRSIIARYDGPDFTVKQPFFAVYSAHAGYQLTPAWNIDLLVNNIFDKNYYSTAGTNYGTFGYFYGAPRNYVLSLTGTFQ
ncbi:TonB-dependent receptor [Tatumella terrea]|uniref:TonB-dependent siderophore receptor n=1 Tax=Tatumella terrea TaxID=419007 RepID=UPI0031D5F0D9